jgi:hypothetical protein
MAETTSALPSGFMFRTDRPHLHFYRIPETRTHLEAHHSKLHELTTGGYATIPPYGIPLGSKTLCVLNGAELWSAPAPIAPKPTDT